MFEFDEYQNEAMRTFKAGKVSPKMDLAILGLGLAGEAGEVVEKLKKYIGHGHKLAADEVALELGDCLWYIATIAEHFGLDLSEVAQANVNKLRVRYEAGFSTEASIARKDVS